MSSFRDCAENDLRRGCVYGHALVGAAVWRNAAAWSATRDTPYSRRKQPPGAFYRLLGTFPPVAWPFMGTSGGSGVFDALQIEGLPISPERVELRDFRALEAVAFAHLQAVQTVAAGSRLAGFYAAVGE